jgi:hypothetical protein
MEEAGIITLDVSQWVLTPEWDGAFLELDFM